MPNKFRQKIIQSQQASKDHNFAAESTDYASHSIKIMDHYQEKLDSFSKFKNNKNNVLNSDKKLGFRKLAAIQGI